MAVGECLCNAQLVETLLYSGIYTCSSSLTSLQSPSLTAFYFTLILLSQNSTMSALPLNEPKRSTFAALRYITPDDQLATPTTKSPSPGVKASQPPKLSLVMPKPNKKGPGSPCSPAPSLSPSSPRMSYAQAAGMFSVPTTPTTPPPTTPKSINSHARIGDGFFSGRPDWTKDMNGSSSSPTPSLSPSSPRMSYAQAAGMFSIPTTPTTPAPTTPKSINSHALIGNVSILNGLGSTLDMKGSQAKMIARPEATRKTEQVSILSIISNQSQC
jgi:hypothetical protein